MELKRWRMEAEATQRSEDGDLVKFPAAVIFSWKQVF